jgi:hypothetical protein
MTCEERPALVSTTIESAMRSRWNPIASPVMPEPSGPRACSPDACSPTRCLCRGCGGVGRRRLDGEGR